MAINKMKKYLFLDDERFPRDVTWIHIDKTAPWEIVRSCGSAIKWVNENGFPDVISFDHDLGEAHYYGNFDDGKTGYDFAKWLVEYDMATQSMPADFSFTIHSMNPIGASNIRNYLFNYMSFKRIRNS
jgi:hypothetical protein